MHRCRIPHSQIMRAAGVSSCAQSQFPSRITTQKITLHDAIFHHLALDRRHAVIVKCAAGQAFVQMRQFKNLDIGCKNLLSDAIQQKGRFPVKVAAAHRRSEMSDQTGSDRRFKQYRHFAGGDFPCTQACRATHTGFFPILFTASRSAASRATLYQ